MQRVRNKAVTRVIPILLPAGDKEGDGWATFEQELGRPARVRVFRDSEIQKSLALLREEQKEHWLAVIEMMKALERKDRLALNKARDRFQKWREKERRKPAEDDQLGHVLSRAFRVEPEEALNWFYGSALSPRARENPTWLLSSEISEALQKVRFILWWAGGRFFPALYCPDLASAFYVRALLTAVRGKGLAVCPHCGDPFIQKRSNQDYCSIAHREAHRVARWRQSKRGKPRRR